MNRDGRGIEIKTLVPDVDRKGFGFTARSEKEEKDDDGGSEINKPWY